VEFDEQRNGDRVDLARGERFAVRLAEQTTAGYRWRVVSAGEPACRLSGDQFAAASARHGAGGVRILQFTTVAAGEGVIDLAYRRSWETNTAPARQFVLRIHVASDDDEG
jgi:inhibitor of cysteine peptidase